MKAIFDPCNQSFQLLNEHMLPLLAVQAVTSYRIYNSMTTCVD